MSTVKVRKLYRQKYAHPLRIKKINQSYMSLCLDQQILYYILVRTMYHRVSSKETTIDTLLGTLYYIMEGYSIDFVKVEYMTRICNF